MGTLGTISLCGQILIYYWPGIAVARCNIVPIKEDLFIGRVYGGGESVKIWLTGRKIVNVILFIVFIN